LQISCAAADRNAQGRILHRHTPARPISSQEGVDLQAANVGRIPDRIKARF